MADAYTSLCIQTECSQCKWPPAAATRSKSDANWYNCLINELVKQIILYHRQNGLLARYDVGQL